MFKANYMDSNCLRCGKTVYPTDKIGPLKDYSFFHSGCFRCVECGSKLTLKAGSYIYSSKQQNTIVWKKKV
jgi:DNA-directed RNA polymerase subunit RPC12/RpoP